MKFPSAGLRGLALREAAPDLMRSIALVRAALDIKINSSGPGADRKWFELEAVYDDRAVICLDEHHWSYPYTLESGVVTLADPQEVMETFIPLKEGAPPKGTSCGAPLSAELRLVEAAGQPAGTVWEATLIQAGVSLNRIYYPDAVLREAAPRFEGARICIKSDIAHIKGGTPDLANVVGWAEAPRFVEGVGADSGRIVATLNLPGLPENTRALLVGAAASGKQNIAGLSIDAVGRGAVRLVEGKQVKAAASIDRVTSVDLIVEPGAGGRLIRLVEAAPEITPSSSTSGDSDMKLREKMLRFVEAKAPATYARLNPETVSDDDLELAYREALKADVAPTVDMAGTEERIRMIEARATARASIESSTLPQPAKDRLQRQFATCERFVEADVSAAIDSERQYLARFVESGRVTLGGFPGIEVEDRSLKMAGMLDAFFDAGHKEHRNTQSFRECYTELTGDRKVTGRLQDCDVVRLRESLGTHFREAVMDTTSFAQILGDSIARRMLADYATPSQYDVWRNLANVVPLTDFRMQHRTRWGGFGDLPAVAEGADYVDGTFPDDEEATYKAAKVGRLSRVTMEMIRNDDVGLIRQIPTKLSRAAKRTLAKFAMDFIRSNAAIYDTKALFHADHGNLGTAALSAAAWSAARIAIMKQVESGSGDRLGIPPKFLWVPSDLEEAAFEMFKNRGTSNDQNFIQTQAPTIVPVWYWTDVTDWAASCDKSDIPSVELGFLDGREEPELFVQDSPTVGSLFANDTITYKLRHVYGGAVTDYRGLYKAVVAG